MAAITVESEVTGNVWKVLVAVGDSVTEGQELMILESMKMEIPVEAPCAGEVSQLLVAVAEAVTEDQALAVVTP